MTKIDISSLDAETKNKIEQYSERSLKNPKNLNQAVYNNSCQSYQERLG